MTQSVVFMPLGGLFQRLGLMQQSEWRCNARENEYT
jgi:hypothetical protein